MTALMTKGFARFARRAALGVDALAQAAGDVAAGRFDADLGGGVYKQRVARPGGGKSGGFRTIIVFRVGGQSFFVHGFGKNEKANVSAKELTALKKLADTLLALSVAEVGRAVTQGELVEVRRDDDQAQQG